MLACSVDLLLVYSILVNSVHWRTWAVNKKKSVFCSAGGRNYGQSGGRNFFFSHSFFFFVGQYCPVWEKKIFFCKNEKKKSPVGPFLDFRHPAAPPETDFFFRLALVRQENSVHGRTQSSNIFLKWVVN